MKSVLMYRIATIAAPVVSVGIATLAVTSQSRRYHRLSDDLAATRTKIVGVRRQIEEIASQPRISVQPTAPLTSSEQTDFLNEIQSMARLCKVQVTHWANVEAVQKPGDSAPDKDKPSNLPPSVLALTSHIELSGQYPDIRRFLYGIANSPRLLTTTNLVWARSDKWPRTDLNFTLSRYIGPPISGLTPPVGIVPELVDHATPPLEAANSNVSQTLHMPRQKVYMLPGLRRGQNTGDVR